MRIKTNDPNRPWLQVSVTGMVEKFAEIKPDRVRLAGPHGTTISAEVEIVPRKDYPFTIEEVKAKDGNFIKYTFIRRCAGGHGSCVIRVENTLAEKGRYVDALYVKTDSKLRPRIPIFVTGLIQ